MERLHTREVAYYLLAVGALALSAVFSYRAAIVYYQLLVSIAGDTVAIGFAMLMLLALTIAEFVASTHWEHATRNVIVIAIVFIHDAAGVFYTIYGGHENINTTISKATDASTLSNDPSKAFLFIGMTLITLLPFVFGHWMAEIAQFVAIDRQIRHTNWVNSFSYRLEKKAAKVYWKWAKSDTETLKKFAPTTIRQYVEGTTNVVIAGSSIQDQLPVPNSNKIDPTIIAPPEKKKFRWFWQKEEEEPVKVAAPKQAPPEKRPAPEEQFQARARAEAQLRMQYPEAISEEEPLTPSQEYIPDEDYEYEDEDPDTDPEQEVAPVVPFGTRIGRLTRRIWGPRSEVQEAPNYDEQNNPWIVAHQDATLNRSTGTHNHYSHSEW